MAFASRIHKTLLASITVATLGLSVTATATPAAAGGCGPWGCSGRYHGHHGGAIAAAVIGGLALGAIATAASDNDETCLVKRRVYDGWGNVVGFRRIRVAC